MVGLRPDLRSQVPGQRAVVPRIRSESDLGGKWATYPDAFAQDLPSAAQTDRGEIFIRSQQFLGARPGSRLTRVLNWVDLLRQFNPARREEIWREFERSTERLAEATLGNWDGEGAVAISQETIDRALQFAENQLAPLKEFKELIPSIDPCRDGSIDVHWDKPGFSLLVNFPVDPHAKADFFGDNKTGSWIKGELAPSEHPPILSLLVR